MNSAATTVSAALPGNHGEGILNLPVSAREAFARFQSHHDPADLDTVLFAMLEDFMPRPPARPLAELPGDTRLMEDLALDSIAITEVVFLAEELFDITITNGEITQVGSLDALQCFIRAKVAARSVR